MTGGTGSDNGSEMRLKHAPIQAPTQPLLQVRWHPGHVVEKDKWLCGFKHRKPLREFTSDTAGSVQDKDSFLLTRTTFVHCGALLRQINHVTKETETALPRQGAPEGSFSVSVDNARVGAPSWSVDAY